MPRVVLASARDLPTDGTIADQRFARSARLTEPKQYKRVFSGAARRGDRYFTVLSVPNEEGRARLGIAVARRTAPRAIDRNRIKRLIRESFRHQQYAMPARDIVVLVKPDARRAGNDELTASLSSLWRRLGKS